MEELEEPKRCFEPGCEREIAYLYPDSSPKTYTCRFHFKKHNRLHFVDPSYESISILREESQFHLEKHNRLHFVDSSLESISILREETKQAIINLLSEEIAKREQLMKKKIDSYTQIFLSYESSLKYSLNMLNSESSLLNSYFEKVYKAETLSNAEQDPVLKLLSLQPDDAITKIKEILPNTPEVSEHLNCFQSLNEEIEKTINLVYKEEIIEIEKNMKIIEETLHLKMLKSKSKIEQSNYSYLLSLVENNNRNLENLKQKIENEASLMEKKAAEWGCSNSILYEKLNIVEKLISEIKAKELKIEKNQILEKSISLETERKLRTTVASFNGDWKEICNSNPDLSASYQDYIEAYKQKTSLFLTINIENLTNLLIYDTENEIQEIKTLETSEPLNSGTCITQLPNGELFCFGRKPSSSISLIIDKDYKFRMLPPGRSCTYSSAVYFNGSVYCFGGLNNEFLKLSEKFNFEKKQWVKLKPLPEIDYKCHCIVFNDEILISGYNSEQLLSYNIKSNSFKKNIDFRFSENTRKILINGERLYLLECSGKIYESDPCNEKIWKQVGLFSAIVCPNQVYCSYNKGVIYIGCRNENNKYYIFHPNLKKIDQISKQNEFG